MAVIDPTDNEASNEASDDKYPEDFEYWDPVTDTYRSKRTHEPVPEENPLIIKMNPAGSPQMMSTLRTSGTGILSVIHTGAKEQVK